MSLIKSIKLAIEKAVAEFEKDLDLSSLRERLHSHVSTVVEDHEKALEAAADSDEEKVLDGTEKLKDAEEDVKGAAGDVKDAAKDAKDVATDVNAALASSDSTSKEASEVQEK